MESYDGQAQSEAAKASTAVAVPALMKAQSVRLADVFFIGPLMFWAGVKLSREHAALGPVLAALGVGTVLYNGRNYLRIRTRA